MATYRRPRNRAQFEIAIICALRIEFDAVEALFDEFWEDEETYGKAPGDPNAYSCGRIGKHNVVLAFMPGMGETTSASVAAYFRASFNEIKLGLVVGICGGVPMGTDDEKEILLGDVVISTGLVQYSFGRQFPDKFVRKDTLQDNLGRPNTEIRSFLGKLSGLRTRTQLKNKCSVYLAELCKKEGFEQSRYPGVDTDKLYEPDYRHKHQDAAVCTTCAACASKDDEVCLIALESSCHTLGCDEEKLVKRDRLVTSMETLMLGSGASSTDDVVPKKPAIHFGLVASGSIVMKSGYHRDKIAAKEHVIAFEMEGAGVWDNFPTVVIKGICDYADSHKNKDWQGYAAATAAACMKALLAEWRVPDKPAQTGFDRLAENLVSSGVHDSKRRFEVIPLETVESYTERSELSKELEEKLHAVHDNHDPPRSLAIHGLGGCGKTQLTLDYIEKHKAMYDAIFWVNVEDQQTALSSFKRIADELGISSSGQQERGQAEIWNTELVQGVMNWLAKMSWGTWLVVLDNADDPEWGVKHLVPKGKSGSVIITSRLEMACDLFRKKSETISVYKMTTEQGIALLLSDHPMQDAISVEETAAAHDVVQVLDCLALAIDLARASLKDTRSPEQAVQQYLKKISAHKEQVFSDESLNGFRTYEKTVKTVWDVSFRAVKDKNEKAAQLLVFLSLFRANGVEDELFRFASAGLNKFPTEDQFLPDWLLHMMMYDSEWDCFEYERAINILKSYSLVQVTTGDWPGVKMHGLVQWRAKVDANGSELPNWTKWIIRFLSVAAYQSYFEPVIFRRHLTAHLMELKQVIIAEARKNNVIGDLLWPLAEVLRIEEWWDEAEELEILVVEEAKAKFGKGHRKTLTAYANLAEVYRGQGRLDGAEILYLQVLEMRKKVLGLDHADTLRSMSNLAGVYLEQGRQEEAMELLVEVLAMARKTLGPEHEDTLVFMQKLGHVYWIQNRLAEAEELEIQVLETRKKTLGLEHIDTLRGMANLALTRWSQFRYDEAYELQAQATDAAKAKLGFDHPTTLNLTASLASILDAMGRRDEALLLLRDNAQRALLKFGENHPLTLKSSAMLDVYEAGDVKWVQTYQRFETSEPISEDI